MQPMYYIGLDVHKPKISDCVKDSGGKLYSEGSLSATRLDLDVWMKTCPIHGARQWKRPCSPGGSTIPSSPMQPT